MELCKGYPVLHFPQKVLLGFVIHTKHVKTLIECVELCFSHNKQINAYGALEEKQSNRCRSIMFYREVVIVYNCLLGVINILLITVVNGHCNRKAKNASLP